ncbi:MAG: 3-oxoacyl-[acyl-carrier-protein] reductase [Pseudomonadota bacterium]|nr:3-oxoacyl-[acyl-carrier-protein] reductase [Pseudomonadota bacterium]
MFDLSNKCALITGASGGIGSSIARALYDQGAKLGISGTRIEVLEELAKELGNNAFVIPANLATEDGPAQLIKDADSILDGVDILINNAGLTRDQLAMRMSDEDWQTVMDVNVMSAFKLSKACLRSMMKKRWGRIIGISSIVGITGNPGQTNYSASKAAMIGMSKSLAQEVASRGITVNCIAPGFIETPMTDSLSDEQKNYLLNRIPAGRLGLPKDVASACVYLAAEEASYVNGQTLHVNGGMAMI